MLVFVGSGAIYSISSSLYFFKRTNIKAKPKSKIIRVKNIKAMVGYEGLECIWRLNPQSLFYTVMDQLNFMGHTFRGYPIHQA
jgi:hypothetical protein